MCDNNRILGHQVSQEHDSRAFVGPYNSQGWPRAPDEMLTTNTLQLPSALGDG